MQQAIVDEQGFQCAFCMSGFIMSTVALLNDNPNPTRQEAAQALSGNLCRCADYEKILTSVMRAGRIHAEVPEMADYKLIGKDFSTPDLLAKVTGAREIR